MFNKEVAVNLLLLRSCQLENSSGCKRSVSLVLSYSRTWSCLFDDSLMPDCSNHNKIFIVKKGGKKCSLDSSPNPPTPSQNWLNVNFIMQKIYIFYTNEGQYHFQYEKPNRDLKPRCVSFVC